MDKCLTFTTKPSAGSSLLVPALPNALELYSARMGRLTEQHMSRVALIAAKREAEARAEEAKSAMRLAQATALSLEAEMDRRLSTEARLSYVSNHDMLTGLANRSQLDEKLTSAIASTAPGYRRLALIHLDIDNFKNINESIGFSAGDMALRKVGERIASCLSPRDLVARLGGDEYGIVWVGDSDADADGLRTLLDRILATLEKPFNVDGHEVFLTVSMGVTFYPDDGSDPKQLAQNADRALHRHKERGRNGYQFFDLTINDAIHRRAILEQGLRVAVARKELFLLYQPQVASSSGLITGVEALARWRHPELGVIPPTEFIPIAEAAGLMTGIGSWILQESCEQAVRWSRDGVPRLKMAVNLAVTQMRENDITRQVWEVLRDTGLPPDQLELEITETGLMSDVQDGVGILRDLGELGVSLAIDDFGTGYSSLGYLRNLPIDRIKIDRSFVTDVTHDAAAAAITSTIVTLARNLKLDVTAEGVETAEHASFVRNIECASAQGFYYSHPVASNGFLGLIKNQTNTII